MSGALGEVDRPVLYIFNDEPHSVVSYAMAEQIAQTARQDGASAWFGQDARVLSVTAHGYIPHRQRMLFRKAVESLFVLSRAVEDPTQAEVARESFESLLALQDEGVLKWA